MSEEIFPPVSQPVMRTGYVGPGSPAVHATIDNRTGLPDDQVREVIEDRWVEMAGLQFAQPSSFQMYSNYQSSMLARTPFKTPGSVIDEMKLARTVADTDDDVGATLGEMIAIAFGEGVVNHHPDEKTLGFFNQIAGLGQASAVSAGIDLESTLEELYREFLITGQVTTLTLFTRSRMSHYPDKAQEPVQAQLQVPKVGILPGENIRVITNDILNEGQLAFFVENAQMKLWLDEYFNPKTPGARRAMMALEEPVVTTLFTGRVEIPYTDSDPNVRGKTVFTMNPRMVHRTTMPKGAMPYARPLLTRNFALLEAKRLLNIMDYALLQGGTNYIVVAKKGTDHLPAQQSEVDNLVGQVTHASRSGVMVGDHRLTIEIITPDLEELLNPAKRKLIGRKISMGLLRQSEQVTGDSGTQGAVNEMELLSRIVAADRNKILRHAQYTFYNDTAQRNRSVFNEGAPTIWAPKVILAGAKDFWSQVLNARDRGDIPRRYAVEQLGFNYDAGLAERKRELQRGDDDVLAPASVPFSSPGEPQDNGGGRPPGTSSNNGSPKDTPGQGADPARPKRTIQRNAGETVKAIIDGTDVTYFGETTLALLEDVGETEMGYVVESEREAIDSGEAARAGRSIVIPVNVHTRCDDYRAMKLGDGLKGVFGSRVGDGAVVCKALRFTEPHYDLNQANEYALRWGFLAEPFVEYALRGHPQPCPDCGTVSESPTCPKCGAPIPTPFPAGGSRAGSGDADVA